MEFGFNCSRSTVIATVIFNYRPTAVDKITTDTERRAVPLQ